MKDVNRRKHRVKSESKWVLVSTPGCVYTQESRTRRAPPVPKSRNTSQEDSAHRQTGWTSPSARCRCQLGMGMPQQIVFL